MSWYTTGTVSLTNGSKTVTGVGTKWTNPLIGVCAGQMLILKTANTIEICEIASVQSDTQLTLASQYSGASKKGVSYEIPTTPKVSIEALALRISEMLNYYQQQMNGWQSILTGTGDITLTAPDGRVVTIKSQKALIEAINNTVKKSGDTITGELSVRDKLYVLNKKGNGMFIHAQENTDNVLFVFVNNGKSTYKIAYNQSRNSIEFRALDDVKIDGKSVLKAGDGGLFSQAPSLPSGTNLLSDDVLSVSQTFTLAGNYLNAPITGITGTLIVTRRMHDAGACATLEINQTNNKYYKTTAHKASNGWVSDGWVEQITTANINQFVPIGDHRLMPFRVNELPFGWYFRNGDNYLLSSPQGQALNGLSANYKRDHRITIKTINGKQYINVPNAFHSDGRGYFERAVNGSARQVGSIENDAIRNIAGGFGMDGIAGTGTNSGVVWGGYGPFYENGTSPSTAKYSLTEIGVCSTMGFDLSRVVPTANENRPINIGLTPTIYLGV